MQVVTAELLQRKRRTPQQWLTYVTKITQQITVYLRLFRGLSEVLIGTVAPGVPTTKVTKKGTAAVTFEVILRHWTGWKSG